ncbi:hypothetical protein EVAR_83536_1 [Eumeta japonica]|uniref:Uncharacterized protein n=1 Tax=Eumeta variegata TaxID=151549 RepID=A0A4C1ZFK6_EUMVA|nr:hypothetical protein EVAR_83536_1 [Eumeta japonica]
MLPQQPDSFNGFYTLPDTLKVRYRQSLPGFHAITGCDFNPAFFRKGKSKPYKTLKKYPEYQEAFKNFDRTRRSALSHSHPLEQLLYALAPIADFQCVWQGVKTIKTVRLLSGLFPKSECGATHIRVLTRTAFVYEASKSNSYESAFN